MKLSRLAALILALSIAAPSVASAVGPPVSGTEQYEMRFKWAMSSKNSRRGRSDSTWVYFKNFDTVTPSTACTDTFFVDLSDAAFNTTGYSLGRPNSAFLGDSAYTIGAQRTATFARDSIPSWGFIIVTDAVNADLDSVRVDVHANILNTRTRSPLGWALGVGNNVWQAVGGVVNISLAGGTTSVFPFTTTSVPLFAPVSTASPVLSTLISRTLHLRGVNLWRIIVKRVSNDEGGGVTKYAIRVMYPAKVGADQSN